ncbi:P-loop containing nucleoside triphosphate hydrolase protein [Mycena leptocephala]|nr:P-loop containing nucleoside triphosphate hydrolase protein [Mycena leptocephala]
MALRGLAFLAFWTLIPQIVIAFKFHSPEGFDLARKILLGALPHFEPHSYQMDGICKVLDGIDLVAVTPTGSGKTGYLFLTILVMIAIANFAMVAVALFPDEESITLPDCQVPKDLAIVVVCPTNSIEQQMDENMGKLGIAALTINSDTVAAARLAGKDLWARTRAGISMLILGPEQLISKGFRDLLSHEPFYDRVCALGVDEIHLLVMWGLQFRKAFQQIGFMRARLRPGIPAIGLTATLLGDTAVSDAIFALLGVNRGEFYLLQRSNARHDIQILFRQLFSGIDGRKFPEIAWVLKNRDKTIIFCRTISLVFRVKAYLNSLLPNDSHRDFRIRTHTGLNWPDEKLQTLADIADVPNCQIIIATNAGWPESIEMYVQKPGRARPTVKSPRAIFYISANRMETAAKIVERTDAENELDARKAAGAKKSVPQMSRSVAEILLAPCKPAEQDREFCNPPSDTACLCATCTSSPAARPAHFLCSGCTPETASQTELYQPAPKAKKAVSDIPQNQRLTKIMKAAGTSRLEDFRFSIWSEASDRTMGLTPLTDFLPDIVIKQILDPFAKIKCFGDLVPFVDGLRGMAGYHCRLLEVILELRETFHDLRRSGK